MRRWLVLLVACLAGATQLVACGADDAEPPEGSPAQPLAAPICSAVTYGGPGRPRFLIVVSSGFQGIYKGHGVQTAQAMKMVLAERGWRAGEYTVGMQACEETDAKTDSPSPAKCARNARAFARNPSVLGVVGPLTSNCAAHMLASLNEAPDGPLAVVSGGNTYVGLTRSGPGTAEGEPERYLPTGRRGYARLAPTDDVQGAANALHARRLGVTSAFVVEDGSPYGRGLAASFRHAAEALGLRLAGTARWSADAGGYRPLAARVHRTSADAVFVAGDIAANGPKLIADLSAVLGRGVQLMAGDSFNLPAPIIEAAGAGAEGLRISIAVLPNRSLPPAGRRFAAEFEKRFSQRPCCFSVHDAQGTRMLLDAIARSGGRRARVSANLMQSRVEDGLIGDFAIDRNGDTTLNRMGIYRIRRGRLQFETAITPAPELLGRE
jgi:branched-chain amino acid transport system substrate-binding protein